MSKIFTVSVLFVTILIAGCGDVNWFPDPKAGTAAAAEVITNTQLTASTAKCCDGTFSQSQNCSGTCSSHGGVEQWLLTSMGCSAPTACGTK